MQLDIWLLGDDNKDVIVLVEEKSCECLETLKVNQPSTTTMLG